jgi:hypothetical protein
MKTKTLLIAAATLAVGVVGSQAAVYSANVVGYVNVVLNPTNFTCITVPVDYDGSGTNNQVSLIIGTNLPVGTSIQSWTSGSVGFNSPNIFGPTTKNSTPHWTTPNAIYNPGQGMFIQNPSNFPVNLTIVGTVLQGGLTNNAFSHNGFSLIGGQFPVAGGLTTTFGYVPVNSDSVQVWNPTNGVFVSPNIYGPTTKNATPHWTTGEPQLPVGGAFFINTTNHAPVMGTNFVIPTP